jgi:adenine C2-methylase RlmN of 23S rRNA A2503 and tRNA A37
MPTATMTDRQLTDVFGVCEPDIYLSLYSMDDAFRRRWLPKAMAPLAALEKLVDWQQQTRKIPVLHGALIENENDRDTDANAIADAVRRVGLRCDVNLVAYNSANERTGREPSREAVDAYAVTLQAAMPDDCRVRLVDRVGYDVKASCGMFVS